MNSGVLNLLIDTVAAALLTALVGTGYLLWFVLPPGTNRTHILWGLLRHQWGTVHAWISVILLTVLAVHVPLHWRWLVMGLSRRFGVAAWAARSPRLVGLTVLTAAALPLTALALAAHVSVRPMDARLHPLADDPRREQLLRHPEPPLREPRPPRQVQRRTRRPRLNRSQAPARPPATPSTPKLLACSRDAVPPATVPTSPPQASVRTPPARCARRKAASSGSRPADLVRADSPRSWACGRQPAGSLRSTA